MVNWTTPVEEIRNGHGLDLSRKHYFLDWLGPPLYGGNSGSWQEALLFEKAPNCSI
jgi:hypothetical protein